MMLPTCFDMRKGKTLILLRQIGLKTLKPLQIYYYESCTAKQCYRIMLMRLVPSTIVEIIRYCTDIRLLLAIVDVIVLVVPIKLERALRALYGRFLALSSGISTCWKVVLCINVTCFALWKQRAATSDVSDEAYMSSGRRKARQQVREMGPMRFSLTS